MKKNTHPFDCPTLPPGEHGAPSEPVGGIKPNSAPRQILFAPARNVAAMWVRPKKPRSKQSIKRGTNPPNRLILKDRTFGTNPNEATAFDGTEMGV